MFARRRSVDQPETLVGAEPVEPAPTAIPPAMGKVLGMMGLDPAALERTAVEIGAMLNDFRARLERIEENQARTAAKVDHLIEIVDRGWQAVADRHPARTAFLKERSNGPG